MPGPDEVTTPETIPLLAERGSTSERLEQLGLDRLSKAVTAAAEERLGVPMSDPHYTQRLAAGEPVPEELRDQPGIDADEMGALRKPWMKNWQNLSIWKRNWHERQAVDAPGVAAASDRAASDVLSDDELAVLERLGLSEQFQDPS